jgi:hypothetical protein
VNILSGVAGSFDGRKTEKPLKVIEDFLTLLRLQHWQKGIGGSGGKPAMFASGAHFSPRMGKVGNRMKIRGVITKRPFFR